MTKRGILGVSGPQTALFDTAESMIKYINYTREQLEYKKRDIATVEMNLKIEERKLQEIMDFCNYHGFEVPKDEGQR